MATIFTVHGTNASGPEEGTSWWQRGSPFQRHVRELVEPVSGELKFQPIVWDGENSESSRRHAANALLGFMRSAEPANEPYCVIGHSHGGSVIANALLQGVVRKNSFQGLKQWITVGTPFIRFARTFSLFSKLGIFGKALYVSLITTFLLTYPATFILAKLDEYSTGEIIMGYTLITAMLLLPFLLFYFVARTLVSSKQGIYKKYKRINAAKHFSDKWVSLCHKSDEAVAGLKALQEVKIRLFSSDFLVPPITLVAIFLLPLAIAVIIYTPSIPIWMHEYVATNYPGAKLEAVTDAGRLKGEGRDSIINFVMLFGFVGNYVLDTASFLTGGWKPNTNARVAFFVLVIAPLLVFAASLACVLLAAGIAKAVSSVLSKTMNHLTLRQLQRSLFGNDLKGENALGADDYPVWMASTSPTLPEALDKEITDLSNASAAKFLARFRESMGGQTFYANMEDGFSKFSEYMSWDELVHTSYFSVPRFRKLVAYAISTADGFRATAQFNADPDYALVKRWYEELRRKPDVLVVTQNTAATTGAVGIGSAASPVGG